MNIEPTSLACVTLVEARKKSWSPMTMFVTVSPNPKTLHKIIGAQSRKRYKAAKYGQMPQSLQYEYCLKLLRVYAHNSPKATIVGTWELNKSGNLHIHFLIDDPDVRDNTALAIYRRDVSWYREMSRNTASGKCDYMNNIVFINKPIEEIATYMDKDYEVNRKIFPNYFIRPTKVLSASPAVAVAFDIDEIENTTDGKVYLT